VPLPLEPRLLQLASLKEATALSERRAAVVSVDRKRSETFQARKFFAAVACRRGASVP
jgi:hypothetical protein